MLEHETVMQKAKALNYTRQVNNEVGFWIYAQYSEVQLGLDNKYAKLRKGMRDNTQLGLPEGCDVDWLIEFMMLMSASGILATLMSLPVTILAWNSSCPLHSIINIK